MHSPAEKQSYITNSHRQLRNNYYLKRVFHQNEKGAWGGGGGGGGGAGSGREPRALRGHTSNLTPPHPFLSVSVTS